jgi:hypothetical protein
MLLDTKVFYDAVRDTYEQSSISWSDYEWDIVKECCAAALREVVKQAAFEDFNNRLMVAQDVLAAADKLETT